MIKKISGVLVLVGALALGGCAGGVTVPPVGGGATLSPLPAPIGNVTIQQIQDAVVKACGFVPTVTTVSGIVASFFPGGAPINQMMTTVASSICNAITPVSSKKAGSRRADITGTPTVGGVRVEGYFTR